MCALLTGVQTCALPIFASAFGSVYAAYGLYDLLAPLIAFLLLALVAFAAFALALLHGPFIAVLALLGGFLTPLLVASPEPAAWGLFAYLLALSAAALAVTRYTACWWLAWGTLTGAASSEERRVGKEWFSTCRSR